LQQGSVVRRMSGTVAQSLIMGVQHVIAMFGATVLALLMGFDRTLRF
jgi:xanthine/uracil permease